MLILLFCSAFWSSWLLLGSLCCGIWMPLRNQWCKRFPPHTPRNFWLVSCGGVRTQIWVEEGWACQQESVFEDMRSDFRLSYSPPEGSCKTSHLLAHKICLITGEAWTNWECAAQNFICKSKIENLFWTNAWLNIEDFKWPQRQTRVPWGERYERYRTHGEGK